MALLGGGKEREPFSLTKAVGVTELSIFGL